MLNKEQRRKDAKNVNKAAITDTSKITETPRAKTPRMEYCGCRLGTVRTVGRGVKKRQRRSRRRAETNWGDVDSPLNSNYLAWREEDGRKEEERCVTKRRGVDKSCTRQSRSHSQSITYLELCPTSPHTSRLAGGAHCRLWTCPTNAVAKNGRLVPISFSTLDVSRQTACPSRASSTQRLPRRFRAKAPSERASAQPRRRTAPTSTVWDDNTSLSAARRRRPAR